MISKQDRVHARTPAQLESQYNFGKRFADVHGIATDARTAATDAEEAAAEAKKMVDSLDHEAVFNLLTKNGALQGLYRGADGELYVNATYIVAGVLDAALVTVKNLIANVLQTESEDGTRKITIDDGKIQMMIDDVTSITISSGTDGAEIRMDRTYDSGFHTATILRPNGVTLMRSENGSITGLDTFYAEPNTKQVQLSTDTIFVSGKGNCKWEYIESLGKTVLVQI